MSARISDGHRASGPSGLRSAPRLRASNAGRIERKKRPARAWIAATLLVITPVDAAAQPAPTSKGGSGAAELAMAQVLFDEAVKQLQAKDFARACPKLEEVVRLVPGKVGAMLTLAECYEGAGKTASAWSRYKSAAETAALSRDAREKQALGRMAALEPSVAKITIRAADGSAEDLEIRRDGAVVVKPLWGIATPIDPGEHTIEAKAQGKKPWSEKVKVEPGKSVEIDVPVLGAEARSDDRLPPPPPPPLPREETPDRRWIGLAIGGAGVLGVGAGAVAGGVAVAQRDQLARTCTDGKCSAAAKPAIDNYETAGLVSTVGLIAGGALLATGVALWIVLPPARPREAPAALVPYVGPGDAGLIVRF